MVSAFGNFHAQKFDTSVSIGCLSERSEIRSRRIVGEFQILESLHFFLTANSRERERERETPVSKLLWRTLKSGALLSVSSFQRKSQMKSENLKILGVFDKDEIVCKKVCRLCRATSSRSMRSVFPVYYTDTVLISGGFHSLRRSMALTQSPFDTVWMPSRSLLIFFPTFRSVDVSVAFLGKA